MNTIIHGKIFIFLLMLSTVFCGATQANISFGVQAPRGNATALKKWTELGKYPEAKIVPLKPNKTVEAVSSGKADFILSNPALAVVLMNKNGSVPVPTMKKKSGHQLAGVITS